jgi:predicted RNase H-like HicB family nuclease
MPDLKYRIETEQETDGRWIADVIGLPGVMAYGQTKEDAIAAVEALALRVIADQIEEGQSAPASVSFACV